MGGSQEVSINVSSSSAANHTVSIGNRTSYLNCFDQNTVGGFLKYRMTGAIGSTSVDANMTLQIISRNATNVTAQVSYSGINLAGSVSTSSIHETWGSNLANLTFVGVETTLTNYGVKTLSHYNYTYDYGTYHYNYEAFVDLPTATLFRSICHFENSTMFTDMVDTNMAWVEELD